MSKTSALFMENKRKHIKSIMFKTCLAVLLLAIIMLTAASISFSNSVNKVLSDNLIRLHVIANSDSEEDQVLKRNVRDAVIDFMRKKLENVTNLEQAKNIIDDDIDEIVDLEAEEDVEEAVLTRERLASLKKALASIPTEMRQAFILKHYYNYSYEEIAGILNCPIGTVRSRIHYSIKKLKSVLDGGISDE